MGEGLQHKMYNLEIPPPTGVWENINAELDQSELSASFPANLRKYSAPPPPEVWQKIAATLDSSTLINDYARRLQTIQVDPPPTAWHKIEAALGHTEKPESRRVIPWFRYAAAAVILSVLAWTGIRLFNSERDTTAIVQQQEPLQKTPVINSTTPLTNDTSLILTDEAIAAEEARNDAALEASKKTFARLNRSVPTKIKNAADFFFVPDIEVPGTRSFDYEEPNIESLNIASRYIVLMTPEGNIIRMSKKLGDLVCCVSGEIDEKDCVDQMNKWREKIAYTPSGHSPGNFLELLNLVNSLQDNQ